MLTTAAPLVFVVDDNPSVRKSLSRLLALAGYTVEAFASAGEFLARAPSESACCLLLDVRMPGLTGIELQATLAAAGRRMSIVFVTGHVDVPTSVKAMKGGAVDLLTKPIDRDALLAAIARAVAKDAADLSDELRIAEIRQRVGTLTPREVQVFARVVTGRLNKQIGTDLGVGEKTIKVHRARVMTKMRARSMAELVRLADAAGVYAGTGRRSNTAPGNAAVDSKHDRTIRPGDPRAPVVDHQYGLRGHDRTG
jgi:two-component system, LuxR family, response regulator FixJ